VLSALQERIAKAVAALTEANGFALAGGAALVLRGEVDRETRDLDFFATEAAAVGRVLPAVEARDFIDVAALSGRYGFGWLCSLASEHDPGFNFEALADALGSFGWLPRLDFDVDDAGYTRLREVVSEWQERISGQKA
jgi:hypothetical protein